MSAGGVLATAGLQLLADGPSDGGELTSVSVSPGLGGFIVMFLLVAVTLLLILDMTRRIRRVNARARAEARHRFDDAGRASATEGAAGTGPANGATEVSSDGEEPSDGEAPSDDGSDEEPPTRA